MSSMKIAICLLGCLAVVSLPEAGFGKVIFQDDFSQDAHPVSATSHNDGPGIGSWASEGTSAMSTSGYLLTYGPAGGNKQDRAAGVATEVSAAGTKLQWNWDWNLLANDNVGTSYRPIAGLQYNKTGGRAVGFWVKYAGASPELTHGDLFYEGPGEAWTDSGIDVPVGQGFQPWQVNYTVGESTFTMTGPGFANQSYAVQDPSKSIVGPWVLGNGSTNARWDNITLKVIPEPGTIVMLAIGLVGLFCTTRSRQM